MERFGRSEMPSSGLNAEGYIEQTAAKSASTFKGKYTYYTINMTEANMNKNEGNGSLYTSLFSSSNTSWLASRCVEVSSIYSYFRVFSESNNNINAGWLYGSNDSMSTPRGALRPIITIDLNSVIIEGEGTTDSPYTITKK